MSRSGIYDTILAVGFEKQSDGHTQTAITTVGDPVWERSIMAGALGNFAVMASTYINESGVTAEQAAKVVVKARRNGANNPYAHLQMPDLTVEEVMKSDVIAFPIRRMDMCPQSDGACAVVLTSEAKAKKLAARPAWIKAVATAHEQQYMGDSPKRLAVMRSQIDASQRLYKMAGITNPRKQLDVAEIYEVASWAELAMYENLGFCERGEAGKLIDDGVTEMWWRAAGQSFGRRVVHELHWRDGDDSRGRGRGPGDGHGRQAPGGQSEHGARDRLWRQRVVRCPHPRQQPELIA